MYTASTAGVRADVLVRDYLALYDQGCEPNLAEYLLRVPAELREEVFQMIDAACANPPEVADNPHLLPETEIRAEALPPAGVLGRVGLVFVPRSIRANFGAEWRYARQERQAEGQSRLQMLRHGVVDLLQGIAQHAPLREPHPGAANTASRREATYGWLAWRLCGAVTLTGVLMGNAFVLLLGGLLLGTAIVAAVRCCDAPDEASRRMLNAVLGGTVAGLAGMVMLGALTVAAIGLSAAISWGGLAAFAVRAMVVAGAFVMALVTVFGWAPEPWWPRRLVRL